MDTYQPLIREVFVIRVWREGVSGTWRGQIVHLPTQETLSFAAWPQAEAFVRRFLGDAGQVFPADRTTDGEKPINE